MWDKVLDAGTGLLGLGLNLKESHKNRSLQRDAMRKGIQWRVHDAKMAGVHPLFALGGPTFNPSPIQTDTSGLDRAADAVLRDRNAEKRHASMAAELLAAQIAETKSRTLLNQAHATRAARAAQASNAHQDPEAAILTGPRGSKFRTSPATSQQEVSDEYGELAGEGYGLYRGLHDAARNLGLTDALTDIIEGALGTPEQRKGRHAPFSNFK